MTPNATQPLRRPRRQRRSHGRRAAGKSAANARGVRHRATRQGFTQYQAGYLPYATVDGWQQIKKDFAYWRALTKAIETAATPEERAWFEADRRLREKITLHDIGIWSHYVGDASQPLHVSVTSTAGAIFRTPVAIRTAKKIHAYFEGEFVKGNLSRQAVAAEVDPFQSCNCSIEDQTRALLLTSLAQVVPLHTLEKEGSFKRGDPRGIAFAEARLAAGVTALRNMIVEAWLDSAQTPIGYPMVNVRDIESGKVWVTRELMGAD
ncbi:hypothetical protein [Reyranella soli]|uniref:S1/P1 Nuclease n=1 Tax=Reyranella soli TaxID=1230389 RepID=A0A512NB46_9HYPH|nr:hypothetical protein [Reyranella soli]GEP56169.1 hypothetical protein RSO01_33350 [Reyranella soli]